ncbi:FAD-dependent oxidoreductase [Planosporangium mesophilum]|uniref:FAD-dependent oxidoreductase n=1 Tax=Planosporangium mesophilum TaxID=689768 RepID=UPI001950AB37|nr:FAD-dependent oxidoreductase [Planosporangium mesophilum]
MTPETDLIVVGGGPAGCAAAVMASSLGLRCVLIEPSRLCHKPRHISAMVNVLGGFADGPDLADRVSADVTAADRCDVRLGRGVTAVRAGDDHVRVDLDDGSSLEAPYAVVATGARPQTAAETEWISQDREVDAPALWEADPSALAGAQALVLGADRPLGTLLRTRPDLAMRLLVRYSPAEAYKVEEVRADPRVVLLPTGHLDLRHDPYGVLHADAADGHRYTGRDVYLNLGSRPVVPAGDLRTDGSGYCPPEIQHSRILVAGDLRGARFQRVMTAFGSGAEAALTAYYAAHGLLG